MNTVPVVVFLELQQFLLKITSIPERYVIKTLPPDRPNETFDEGMRERYIGHGLHLRDLENPQISLPAMELEQWIMVAAEILRVGFRARYRFVKEPADGRAIDATGLYADSNDSTSEMVHDDQDPVGLEE